MKDLKKIITRIWKNYKHLTKLGLPRRFQIVQFPNLALAIALISGFVSHFTHGLVNQYILSTAYLAMTIWAYGELSQGVNWFRRLLGVVFLIIIVMRVAHTLHV